MTQGATTAAPYANPKSFEMLWGSVHAGDSLMFSTGKDMSAAYRAPVTITGSDILAAAQTLGLGTGNSGSFYVVLNAVGTENYINTFKSMAGSEANPMEWRPLAYSLQTVSVPTPTGSNSGGPGGVGALPRLPLRSWVAPPWVRRSPSS